MEITRSALVPFTATNMFRLVEDVPSYPQFLSWCVAARVKEQGVNYQIATLEVSIGGMRQSFTTRNSLVEGEKLSMALLEGPFQRLAGEWRFEALNETACKVILQLNFDFSGSLLSAAFRRGFATVADRLVGDFCARAEAVYMPNTSQ